MGLKSTLASATALAVLAAAKPGIIEADLIFPRNETYKPTDVLPIVFSFQDPNGASLDAGGIKIGWTLIPLDGSVNLGESSDNSDDDDDDDDDEPDLPYGVLDVTSGANGTGPYFWDLAANYTGKETQWMLSWDALADNCTDDGGDDGDAGRLFFTTSAKGKAALDIAPKDCGDAQSRVLNVTARAGRDVTNGSGAPSCGFADSRGDAPKADPCKVKLSSDEARKIAAAVNDRACHMDNPVVKCGQDSGARALTAGSALVLAGAAWLVSSLVL